VWVLLWLWLVAAVSTLLAEFETTVLWNAFVGFFLTLAQCFCLYWLGSTVLCNRRTAAWGLLSFAAGAATMASLVALGIGRKAIQEGDFQRVTFLTANANIIGVLAAVGILVVLGLISADVLGLKRLRFALLVLVPPMLGALIRSGSRGAVVSLGLGLFCFLLMVGSWLRRVLIGACVISLALAVFLLSQGGILGNRMQESISNLSMSGREELWPAAVALALQKPMLGWGVGFVSGVRARDSVLGATGARDPHNAFLAWFVFGGLLAGVPFAILAGWWLYRAYWCRRGQWGMLPLALAVVIISTLAKGGGFYISKVAWVVLAFVTAAASDALSSRGRIRDELRRHAEYNRRAEYLASGRCAVAVAAPCPSSSGRSSSCS
jgi:O-antigen ligase